MKNESGFALLLFSITIVCLLVITGLALDIGVAYWQRKIIQVAVDAAAIAGVDEIIKPGATSSSVSATSQAFGTANGLTTTELSNAGGITTGKWNNLTNSFVSSNDMLLVNAVKVRASRQVATNFAKVIGYKVIRPNVEAIAVISYPSSSDCVIPYGIEQPLLVGKRYGDVIIVDRDSPGNWGKLDIGGNMSAGPEFIDAITSNSCTNNVNVGENYSPATGFAGVVEGFEQRKDINPIIVIAVVDDFPNGNSTPVQVMGFVAVEIVSTQGSGNNWRATLKFLNYYTGNGTGGSVGQPYAMARVLVK